MTSTSGTNRDALHRWPAAGLAALGFAAATFTKADADLWGHVRFGLDVIRDRHLTATDPYSFTQDRPWLNHEWLSEAQMGLAYIAGGPAGLALLKAALAFVVFWLIWRAVRGASTLVRIGLLVVVALGTVHMTSSLRPQLWTFLCFGVLCRVLSEERARLRWWLPLLFVVWANVHGGWIVGLGVLGVWAVFAVASDRRMAIEWMLVVALSAVATLCTPYGWRLWDFMWQTVHASRSISEWQPLWRLDAANWVAWVVGVTLTLWAAAPLRSRGARQKTRLSPTQVIVVLVMLAYASLRVMRIGSLFVEAAAIFLAPVIVARWPARANPPSTARSGPESLAAAYLFVAGLAGAGWIASQTLRCIPLISSWMPDQEPVRWLASAEPGRLVTYFDWGEYAIWHLGPRLRVSMDGRRETVYTDQRLAEHDAIVEGTADGLATLAEWRPDYVWLPASSAATKMWLASHGYRIDLETSRSFVAARDDHPPLRIPATPTSTRRCFPE